MREKELFETVKIHAIFLTVEQVLVSEKHLNFLSIKRNTIFDDFTIKEHVFRDVAQPCKIKARIRLFRTPKHIPKFFSQFVSNRTTEQLLLNTKLEKLL